MNAKHQFKYTYNEGCEDFSPLDVTFDMPGDVTITQMLYNFQSYLKACGFVFDGNLEIVPEEGYDLEDLGWEGESIKEWNRDLEEEQRKVKKNNSWYEKDHCCSSDYSNVSAKDPKSFTQHSEAEMSKWAKAEKKVKDFTQRLDPQNQKNEDKKMWDKIAEVTKQKWVHGMCNPPASDWSEAKNEPDNCWNS